MRTREEEKKHTHARKEEKEGKMKDETIHTLPLLLPPPPPKSHPFIAVKSIKQKQKTLETSHVLRRSRFASGSPPVGGGDVPIPPPPSSPSPSLPFDAATAADDSASSTPSPAP